MITLRDYQARAVENIFREWESVRSTLYVAATGTGKTTTFGAVVERVRPDRTLILAHREELIFQAQKRITEQVGLDCQIEMADYTASTHFMLKAPVVVATIQTLISGNGDNRRMHRFKPQDFGLLVIDEGHHSVAASYRKVIDYFSQNPNLKILGCTATPDRADEEALGQIFETVADVYEIGNAIDDGWLVPIDQQMVTVEELDFSAVRTTAGDLNYGDLAAVMEAEKVLHGICSPTIEIIGDRQTLVFTSSVRHAEMTSNIFNRHRSGMCDWICGKTNKDRRRDIMKEFLNGDIQVLCNVGCITEGVDVPPCEIAVMARPTKSRSLYAQMAGRILRPLTGLVDDLYSAEDRRHAIATSPKPSALIIDFAGNSGRHKLVTSADILGGKFSERAIELATRKARESGGPIRMDEELKEAEKEIRRQEQLRREAEERQRAHLTAKAKYTAQYIDPFNSFDLEPAYERGWDMGKSLSLKQRALFLKVFKFDPNQLPYAQARQLLNEQFRRWKNKLCTMKQAKVLKKFGYDTKEMTMKHASELLDQLAKNRWRRLPT